MQGNEEKPTKGYSKEVENKKSSIALREEEILKFWKDNETFKKSLEKDAPKGNYVFYDGPPFATGLPHYGHILGSTAKDVIGRYQTMRGFRVPRRWGALSLGYHRRHHLRRQIQDPLDLRRQLQYWFRLYLHCWRNLGQRGLLNCRHHCRCHQHMLQLLRLVANQS
jgi:hypothetical protein